MNAAPPHPADWTLFRGWSEVVIIYLITAGGIAWGHAVRRSPLRDYLGVPILAVIVMIVCATIWTFVASHLSRGISIGAGLAFNVAVGFAVGRILPLKRKASHQRGAIVKAGTEAFATPHKENAPHTTAALTLAGLPVPSGDEVKHFKLIGTTGTGKSTAIRELLAAALHRGDRAVIADPDAGYLARFFDPNRGDVILNPFDARSLKWDLFAEIRNPYDFEQLARSLLPGGAGEDRMWHQYAQTFLTAVMRQAHGAGIRDSGELYRLLTAAPLEELRLLLEGTPAQPFLAPGNDRMFGSTRSVTTSAVSSLFYITGQHSALFSIRRWIQEGRGVLFLPYQANQIAALRAVISTWMRIAIFETMTLPEADARLWFVVDELDALGPIDGLKDALPRVRKFGGRCVLGFQSIAQVAATYGRGEADTIVENCGNTLILRCSASEGGGTARFASKLIGEREIIRETISRSQHPDHWFSTKTTSEQHVTESAVLASEIEQLPDLQGYLKFTSQPEWRRVQLRRVS